MPTVSVSSITSGMAILAQHEQRAADADGRLAVEQVDLVGEYALRVGCVPFGSGSLRG